MLKKCRTCGEDFKVKPSAYDKRFNCSTECMALEYRTRLVGKNNPNSRRKKDLICKWCGAVFHSYDKGRKYCSKDCYIQEQRRMSKFQGRPAKRKDNNQGEVVAALKKAGCLVADTSGEGRGFPDIVVAFRGEIYLMEIKNPETKGRLTKRQKEFHKEWEEAGKYLSIVWSPEEALAVVGAI